MTDLLPVQGPPPVACVDSSITIAPTSSTYEETISISDHRVYDQSILDELQEIFGRPKLMELLARLKVEIAERLLATVAEPGILGRDAHTLLSVSGTLGFVNLSRRCSEMERACLLGTDLVAPLMAARQAAAQAIAAIDTIEANA